MGLPDRGIKERAEGMRCEVKGLQTTERPQAPALNTKVPLRLLGASGWLWRADTLKMHVQSSSKPP